MLCMLREDRLGHQNGVDEGIASALDGGWSGRGLVKQEVFADIEDIHAHH